MIEAKNITIIITIWAAGKFYAKIIEKLINNYLKTSFGQYIFGIQVVQRGESP